MASAQSPSAIQACPKCGARFEIPASLAGKRARCGACGEVFRVTEPETGAKPSATPQSAVATSQNAFAEAAGDADQYIGFECHLCSTRMYARGDDVGKKFKCPDCGASTVVPPPPPPKAKNIPAALEGEQYELWDADAAPLPSEITARQPKFVAITCKICGTAMYPTEQQIGQVINCPDCGAKNAVVRPAPQKAKRNVMARDDEMPRLDPAAAPGERPAYTPTSDSRMVHEVREADEYARAVEKSRRTGKPMEIDIRGRPIMPPWPLVTGVWQFLLSPGLFTRWAAFSIALTLVGKLFFYAVDTAMMGGLAAIAGMCFYALAGVLFMLFGSGAASVFYNVITESSEGNRTIHAWSGFGDWFGAMLMLLTAVTVSAVPGYALSLIPAVPPHLVQAILWGVVPIVLPIVMMSQLDINSAWGILSPRILTAMAWCFFSTVVFYAEVALIVAICAAATFYLAGNSPRDAVIITPMYYLAFLFFGRLLGRLGWRLAEALPIRD